MIYFHCNYLECCAASFHEQSPKMILCFSSSWRKDYVWFNFFELNFFLNSLPYFLFIGLNSFSGAEIFLDLFTTQIYAT